MTRRNPCIMYLTIVWAVILAVTLALLLLSCGSAADSGPWYDETWIDGPATAEEEEALEAVLAAFKGVGLPDPCYRVVFVREPEQAIRGTTWAEFRLTKVQPRNLAEGYRGLCDRAYRTVYVRRFGEAEPYLISLLIHELVHAVGYDHGPEMRRVEKSLWDSYGAVATRSPGLRK